MFEILGKIFVFSILISIIMVFCVGARETVKKSSDNSFMQDSLIKIKGTKYRVTGIEEQENKIILNVYKIQE